MGRRRRRKPRPEQNTPARDDARQPLPRRTKVVFSLLTVMLVLGGLEGVSRLVVRMTPNARWEHHCRLVDTLGFSALNEILTDDDDLFWKVRPNLDGHELSGRIANGRPLRFAVSTDRHGFRRSGIDGQGRQRVAFVGDSCTFGVGVENDQTFVSCLQERLPETTCINMGVPGYTAFQGHRQLQAVWPRSTPDVVVITFGFNDALSWDGQSDIEHAASVLEERTRFVNQFRLTQVLRGLLPSRERKAADVAGTPRPRLSDDEYARELEAMVTWCRQRRVQPILVMWPQLEQLGNTGIMHKQYTLLRVAREMGVRHADILAEFRAEGDVNLFLDNVHASPAGCTLAADTLLPVIADALRASSELSAAP